MMVPMDLTPYLGQLRTDLEAATALADDQTRTVAARLPGAIEPALQLAFVQLLSDACAELTAQLGDTVVECRMNGREPQLVVQRLDAEPSPAALPELDGDETTARITLRLPEAVKNGADQAAQAAGQSLNTWITQACRAALTTPPTTKPRHATRVTGWA